MFSKVPYPVYSCRLCPSGICNVIHMAYPWLVPAPESVACISSITLALLAQAYNILEESGLPLNPRHRVSKLISEIIMGDMKHYIPYHPILRYAGTIPGVFLPSGIPPAPRYTPASSLLAKSRFRQLHEILREWFHGRRVYRCGLSCLRANGGFRMPRWGTGYSSRV